MSRYVLSEAADADIAGIARHSITQWGLARAERYVRELHQTLETLSELPDLGGNVGHVRPGYFRFDH